MLLVSGRVSVPKPLSQIQRSTLWLLQGLSPRTSFGGFGLKEIAPFGADLLGAGSTRRYLVLGQSADELRATGGFVSSIWLVTFENGGLADIRYHDTVRVDDWERLDLYPRAPQGLEEHMNAHVWLLRDVSWEPDFPSTALVAADMYKIGQGRDVDGVVALNQWTLLSIVEALGGVPSPGGESPMTPQNLLARLEQGSDEHGRAYMDLALQGIISQINQPVSLPDIMRLASTLGQSLQRRDLMLFLEDPQLQEVVRNNGWDGGLRHDATDYLYVVDSNVGWSKADRNIERRVTYQVDLTRGSGPRASLTLGYNNHGGPGSPGCKPQWLNRGTNYSQLKNACYWNYWRVYVPQEARLLANTPLALPEYSVSVEVGRGQAEEDTVKVSSSYNRTVISGLLASEAGEEKQVNLVYGLSPTVLLQDGEEIKYSLLIQKQPGARRTEVSVEFMLPQGYSPTSSSHPPSSLTDSLVQFLLQLEQDTVLNVVFAKSADSAG